MPSAPAATVVVVVRDRWAQAPRTLDLLLARTDERHPVVVVDARAPRAVGAAFDRWAAAGRIQIVRRDRQLAGNVARNLGADGVRTEWIAFVENDAVPCDGWLETLLHEGEARDAASVYPAYLMEGRNGPKVHGLGADLEVGGPEGARYIRERQHHTGKLWRDVAEHVEPVERVQSEPHAFVIRREAMERMGGMDEGLLGWFDHTDLALQHKQLGLAAWFVPAATTMYRPPPPVALVDVPSFLLRWGEDWFDRSLHHLCRTWGLDPNDSEWQLHSDYRKSVRRGVPTPWRRVNEAVNRAAAPVERRVARRLEARR